MVNGLIKKNVTQPCRNRLRQNIPKDEKNVKSKKITSFDP